MAYIHKPSTWSGGNHERHWDLHIAGYAITQSGRYRFIVVPWDGASVPTSVKEWDALWSDEPVEDHVTLEGGQHEQRQPAQRRAAAQPTSTNG